MDLNEYLKKQEKLRVIRLKEPSTMRMNYNSEQSLKIYLN